MASMINCLLAGWLPGLLAGWLAGLLAGWLAGLLAGWLLGWLTRPNHQKKSLNFFLAQSKKDSLGIRFRRSMTTALNAENSFLRNSFPGDPETSISGM